MTRSSWLTLIAILVIALNLRAPFTSLAPVLEPLMKTLSLTSAQAGFLTAIPLVAFAIFSILAGPLSKRLGIEKCLVFALLFIAGGVIIRSVSMVSGVFIGTLLIGVGIAIGNVLLPVVVKTSFPTRIAMLTALYTFTMGVGSTMSASAMVPLTYFHIADLTGWQFALLCNLLFPCLAMLFWLPRLAKQTQAPSHSSSQHKTLSWRQLARSPVAWCVTLALGLNSFTFYSFAGWLPKILTDLHYSELTAGYIYGFLQLSTMLPGLILMPILAKKGQLTTLVLCTTSTSVISLIGLIFVPQWAVLWVGLFGFSNCSNFIIGLSFVGLRTANAQQAAALSGASQSIGYALAATGPTLIGTIHTATNGWHYPLLCIAVAALGCLIFSGLASRDKMV